MKVLFVILSIFTIPYGLTVSSSQSKAIKIFGRVFFIIHLINDGYNQYDRIGLSLPDWLAYVTYYVASLIFGFVLIFKGNLIVNSLLNDINLLSKFQYKLFVFCSIAVFLIYLIDILFVICLFVSQLTGVEVSLGLKDVRNVWFALLSIPYYEWISISSIIYSLLFFQMYLKQKLILSSLRESKNCSYTYLYKILTKIQLNHDKFDSLVSIFPTLWLIHIFFGANLLIVYVKSNPILSITMIIKQLVCWPFMLILVNICYSKLKKEIFSIKYNFAVYYSVDDVRSYIYVKLLNEISKCHVTIAYYIPFDKGIILPFLASLCTFTFLFLDNFKGKPIEI